MYSHPTKAEYQIKLITDTIILIIDNDKGRSVTNDADRVIDELEKQVTGGIGNRSVYYRDTMGRFDELATKDGKFDRFKPCTANQQDFLSKMA